MLLSRLNREAVVRAVSSSSLRAPREHKLAYCPTSWKSAPQQKGEHSLGLDFLKIRQKFDESASLIAVGGGVRIPKLTVAQFIKILYGQRILTAKSGWTVPRIVQEMHGRLYNRENYTKPSYGAELPPLLGWKEVETWTVQLAVIARKYEERGNRGL